MRYLDNVNQSITERRDIVIETAFKLFAENRIEPVTMTIVANNCNMGVASIYRYFGTKKELVIAVATKKWREYYGELQRHYNELNVEDIDILIVPAVAYDKDCYRLGYGGGFYDRFIEHLRDDAITIGIAFDLQVFDSIPKENHDAQLNYVITENNMYIGKI